MKCTVTFDLTDEEDRIKYANYLVMDRNARFWNDLYAEVFRKPIRYSQSTFTVRRYRKVWQDVAKYMEELRYE